MMYFSLYVQQNQWIVVSLLAGIILTIMLWLTYWAMWRPRRHESVREPRIEIRGPGSFFRWVLTFMPWVLVLVIIGTTLYTITHLYLAATTVPNW
ncbi:hypothetical protein [Geobacter sp. DSM 9736]|uniref:hypothetical protein n=1 Tax=Geobacter sp. DSM 9736 TaxID=1277350 RepID=UPI000B50CD04|nr:hypothetical protein [Geobacter sp. DSM 9736]SNB46683.1 hypothetical protein SAMN06269301_2153 [Geobacter sp. DSM 9736]